MGLCWWIKKKKRGKFDSLLLHLLKFKEQKKGGEGGVWGRVEAPADDWNFQSEVNQLWGPSPSSVASVSRWMYNVCIRLFGETWASFGEGVIPLHPAPQAFPQCLADTHKHTHKHVHKGINCVQFHIVSYWPTATGRLSQWRRPDQIQGCLSRLGETNQKGSLSPSPGGKGGSGHRWDTCVWDFFIKYITLGCSVEHFGARASR